MGLSVRLEVFEGPLDLLLYLIEKNKLDIYDIPIVVITEQYLAYIKNMQTEDMGPYMRELLERAIVLSDRAMDSQGKKLIKKALEYIKEN